jgi:3-deoxy-D-manno-octulosonic-acid transferase
MLKIYISVSYIFHFFSKFFLYIRVLKKKEDPLRYKEKLGKYKIQNITSVIWFHAASLGEVKSILPIIFHFSKDKNYTILITTNTLSSSQYCIDIIKNYPNIIHQFAPIDTPIIVKKFLNYWKPKISIFVESELWPNLILQSKKVSKLILLNARISEKSFSRWKLIKKFASNLLSQFDSILSQSKETRVFIEFFNTKNIYCFGNLKFASSDELSNNKSFNFEKTIKHTWVAMSTHPGEEDIIIKTVKNIKEMNIKSQCILVPRHINRVKKITKIIKANNLTFQLKSQEVKPFKDIDFYILDSYGETKEIFKKISLVFLGGSIVPHGGQNPLEPAREGCFLFHGPNVANFNEIYQFLNKNEISKLVTCDQSLTKELVLKFENPTNNIEFQKKMEQHGQKILLDHINHLNSFIK